MTITGFEQTPATFFYFFFHPHPRAVRVLNDFYFRCIISSMVGRKKRELKNEKASFFFVIYEVH